MKEKINTFMRFVVKSPESMTSQKPIEISCSPNKYNSFNVVRDTKVNFKTKSKARIGRSLTQLLSGLVLIGVTAQAMALNAIQTENLIASVAADYQWNAFPVSATLHTIEGYASQTSVSANGSINIFANVNAARNKSYTINIYRLGWYGGTGARWMATSGSRTSITQVLPTPNPTTGMVEANWKTPYTLTIPSTWVSGVYVATLVGNTTGEGNFVPFVVKNTASTAAYLFQTSDTTWQAYNAWGGKSLYGYNSTGGIPAVKVSYNRPYDDTAGIGGFSNYEFQMVRFLEREGYDVTYQSKADTDGGGISQLQKHKVFLSVGHDEYWTLAMRNNVENAKNTGVSLGFFGSNASYWQVRFETSPITGAANRTLVGYKEIADTQDPYALDNVAAHKLQVTTMWRDPTFFNRPENAMIGVMYVYSPVNSDLVVSNASNGVFLKTGLVNGDKMQGTLGYEVDAYFNTTAYPAPTGNLSNGVQILAHSPYIDGSGNTSYSDMTVYAQSCSPNCYGAYTQATVFAAGTMQWIYGLDSSFSSFNIENDTVKQATRNFLQVLSTEGRWSNGVVSLGLGGYSAWCPNEGLISSGNSTVPYSC